MSVDPNFISKLPSLQVKEVKAGDRVTAFPLNQPIKMPPEEIKIIFNNVQAPKAPSARFEKGKVTSVDKGDAWGWEAREFLRRKLVGEEIKYKEEKKATSNSYGTIYIDKKTNYINVTELMIREGFIKVKENVPQSDEVKALKEEESNAVAAKKGLWSGDENRRVDIKWTAENVDKKDFLEKHKGQPIDAVIERVRDGYTVDALLLPDYQMVTVMMTGISCKPKSDPFGIKAACNVERLLLQRDVKIFLEGIDKDSFVGTILHPKGNIAELLLEAGLALTVPWMMSLLNPSVKEKLQQAEKKAKTAKRGLWEASNSTNSSADSKLASKKGEFQAVVVEVGHFDALTVKNGNETRKIFLASIKPPQTSGSKDKDKEVPKPATNSTQWVSKALYNSPFMFEAREYLRKTLIGKKIHVVVDYVKPATKDYQEKVCCTVTIGGVNVAESLVAKGLASVMDYKNPQEERSSQYSLLKAAEDKAEKGSRGVYSKSEGTVRVTDASQDAARARTYLSSLQRLGKVDAVVEQVTSGSRLKLFVPRESWLINFLLGGINCPKGARRGQENGPAISAEPFGEEALAFTKEKVMQRDVEIVVESMDKANNFIGWLWIDGVNLSVALVAEGLAEVHFSAEKSEHYRALKNAENSAKSRRVNLWKDYVEKESSEEKVEEDVVAERKVDQKKVIVVEATKELKFYAQFVDEGPKLESLMNQIRQDFQANPPLPGAFTPHKGHICAARFSDDEWYRARVERVQGNQVHVYYIDYGNREVTTPQRCASLSATFTADRPYAHEYGLAFVKLPKDPEYQEDAIRAFKEDVEERSLLLNEEYKIENTIYATLTCPDTKNDIGKALVLDGYFMVDHRREKRLQKLMGEYKAAQDEAKKGHKVIWQYGDITEDDAKEFGR